MPRNLVTAQTVVRVHYAVPGVNQAHVQTLYLDCQSIQLDVTFNISLFGVVNPATSADWLLHDVIKELWQRHIDSFAGLATPVSIGLVEVWHNVEGSEDEVFVGFDTHDYTDVVGGVNTPFGGSAITYNFQTPDRQNARIVFLDQGLVVPLKMPGAPIPAVDDSSLAWFVVNSSVPFSNNDGVELGRYVSASLDWNDKLLRTYGYAHNLTEFLL